MIKSNIKVLVVFGTRPEAIKMVSIIKELKQRSDVFDLKVCVTAQHRSMLDQVLTLFDVTPDYDLNIMRENQTLHSLTASIIERLSEVINTEKPDCVVVQGDTTTTLSSSLASFYQKVQVVHVEAGLRTDNKYSPFPEEINRRLTSHLADIHFAPTEGAKMNLIEEGISEANIFVTGNTVIDALLWTIDKLNQPERDGYYADYFSSKYGICFSRNIRTILVTGHRRESFGEGFRRICSALSLLTKYNNVQVVYPVHLNPNVQKPVYSLLGNIENLFLIEPLDYEPFIYLMSKCYLILTDSGGIQEEAPSLGKPVLVLRDTTERSEGVSAGTAKMVGTNVDDIVSEVKTLLDNQFEYHRMAKATNPYGCGNSAKIITNILESKLKRLGSMS